MAPGNGVPMAFWVEQGSGALLRLELCISNNPGPLYKRHRISLLWHRPLTLWSTNGYGVFAGDRTRDFEVNSMAIQHSALLIDLLSWNNMARRPPEKCGR